MIFLLAILGLFPANLAEACASCGSGGDEGLVLYPGEAFKASVAASRLQGFRNRDASGRRTRSSSAISKESLSFGAGAALSAHFFVTVSESYWQLTRFDKSRGGWGDPLFSARYTALPLQLAEPWRPQLQLLAARRWAKARSIRGTRDDDAQLDVFGSGFDESKVGLDLWFGMLPIMPGVAYSQTYFGKDGDYRPGRKQVWTLSLAATLIAATKITLGWLHDERDPMRRNGVQVAGSRVLNRAVYLNFDRPLDSDSSLRLGYFKQGLGGYGGVDFESLNLAYFRTF